MGYSSASLWNPEENSKLDSGYGLAQASQPSSSAAPVTDEGYKGMAKGGISAMNAGSSVGGALTGAGIYGMMSGGTAAAMGPYALGAGLALSAWEQKQKADAMNEQARIEEAQQRKAAVQGALNSALGATRQLGV
jgi:hypothetical protein